MFWHHWECYFRACRAAILSYFPLFKCSLELCFYALFVSHCMSPIFVPFNAIILTLFATVLACIGSVWGWFGHLSIALHDSSVICFTSFRYLRLSTCIAWVVCMIRSHFVCHFSAETHAIILHVSSFQCSWRVVFCALGLGHCIIHVCVRFGALISASSGADLDMAEAYPFWYKSIVHWVCHVVHSIEYAMWLHD
mgnify:CR=1 FL=1